MNGMTWSFFKVLVKVQLKVRTLSAFTLGVFVLQPATFAVIGMLLSRAAGSTNPDLIYNVIGGGIMGMWSGLIFNSSYDITSDRRNGTLELIVGSPTSLRKIEAVRTLTNLLTGLISLVLAFFVAVVIFGFSLRSINVWGACISFLLLLLGFWSLGMFFANFFAWSRVTGMLVDYLEMPVAFLCGFMYPIRVLPTWLQWVANFIPIRWALEGMNESLLGNKDVNFLLYHWAFSLVLSAILIGVTRKLEQKVEESIRVTGELSSI